MFPSILTFDFDSILGSFLSFWGPNGLVGGSEQGSTTVFGSTHVVEQLLYSIFPSILTFNFDILFGSFLTFRGPNGLFLGSGQGSKTVQGSTYINYNICFQIIALFLLYHVVLSLLWWWQRSARPVFKFQDGD